MAGFSPRTRWVLAVLACFVVVMVVTVWRLRPRSPEGDALRAGDQRALPPGNHPAAPQNIELSTACDTLASSAPADIVKHWVAAYRATRNALEREVWIRDRFAWMDLHKVETTLATCGIRGAQALGIIEAIAKDEDYGRFVREEREAICTFGQKLAIPASGASAWRDDTPVLWNAACVRLLSGPGGGIPSAPHVVPSPSAAPAAVSCAGLDTLSATRAEMASRSLGPDAWLLFGRTLAACGPETNPWDALHLERGREQFVDDYVAPFLNGDVTQGSPFQKQVTDLYDRIVTAWGLEE